MFGAPTHRPQAPAGTPPRVLLATQPKAGTYLLSSVLARLGFHQTHYHLNKRRMQAYDPALLELGAQQPRLFDVQIKLGESLKLIRHGEFAASHLAPRPDVLPLIRDQFVVVTCLRNLRTSLKSYARFSASTSRKAPQLAMRIREQGVAAYLEADGKRAIRRALWVAEWRQQPNAFVVRFEDLKSDPDKGVGPLADFLGVRDCNPAEVLDKARAGQSLTKSDDFILLDWDDAAEEVFVKLGGIEANRKLGYYD